MRVYTGSYVLLALQKHSLLLLNIHFRERVSDVISLIANLDYEMRSSNFSLTLRHSVG